MSRHSKPRKVDLVFRRLQLVSAGLYSIGHGANDAQKTMGIIVALLVSAGQAEWATGKYTLFGHSHEIALWIVFSCNITIALGTLFGGWRIIKTMGDKITRLQPIGGFCAETAGAATLIGTALWGIPVSTTHAITGAILGVGSARNIHSVRWIWGQRIVVSWILTLPCSADRRCPVLLACLPHRQTVHVSLGPQPERDGAHGQATRRGSARRDFRQARRPRRVRPPRCLAQNARYDLELLRHRDAAASGACPGASRLDHGLSQESCMYSSLRRRLIANIPSVNRRQFLQLGTVGAGVLLGTPQPVGPAGQSTVARPRK